MNGPTDEPPGLVEHLESKLGPIERGWARPTRGSQPTFQIVRFKDAPARGVDTYSTLGLSDHVLDMPRGHRVRQELLFCCHRRFSEWDIPGVFGVVADDVLAKHQALLRGEVLGPAGPLFRGSTLEALYCTMPAYFPEGIQEFGGTQPPTVVAWLVPISIEEHRLIVERGWNAFEDELETRDPDLLDLQRASLRLAE